MLKISVALALSSSESMASSSRGFSLMLRAIFFSSSSCSLVFVISLRASPPAPPATDFFLSAPAPAFWASSISFLFFGFLSFLLILFLSEFFFLFFLLLVELLFLLSSDFFPLCLLFLQLLELLPPP